MKNIDVLEMTNRLFKNVYGKFYLDLVNKAPHALGYFYDLLDQPTSPKKRGKDGEDSGRAPWAGVPRED